ncbi:MAG: glycosyltransferase family 39 protein [Candidatus Ratteibacteria bacterium]|nr:glycosyltransferase family 39 protein [Candidatus Ratteibacteria bacterium]
MKWEKTFVGILFLFFLFIHFYGINWGVPNSAISSLVFKNTETEIINKLSSVMLTTHQEIKEMTDYYGTQYRPNYQPKEKIILKVNDTITTSKELVNSCRSYLIRSAGADEQRGLLALSKINPAKCNFDPHFYEYGGVYLYPMGASLYILSKLKILTVTSDMSFYFLHPDEMGKMYIWGRVFGAIGSLISIIVFFLICKELFKNKRLVYLLTFFYGTSAGFAIWSHYLKPFSYGMLWFLSTLYMLVKFYKGGKEKHLYFASIFSGLSFGTLLSYGYIYWAVVVFIIFYSKNLKWKVKHFFLTFIIFLCVFFITNPYVLISHKEFWQELQYLKVYWQRDIFLSALSTFVFNTLRYGLGILLWATLLAGFLGSVFYKPDKLSLMLLAIILPAFFYFAFTTAEWVHYSIFLYPLFIVSTGLFLTRLRYNKILALFFLIVVSYTALYTLSYVKLFGMENTRTEAGEWINNNIPCKEKIGLFEPPSPWRTPPFRFLDYNLIITADKTEIEKERPEYFVVSEYQWLRGSGMETIKDILSNYTIFNDFEREPSFLGIKFKHPEKIPYDWCHPNPVILIWKRKH